MHVVILLHSNIRSGANLAVMQRANHIARSGNQVDFVFEERFFSKQVDFFDLPRSVRCFFLDEYGADARSALADIVITNWWQCAYRFSEIPARCYGYWRHGNENALYDSHCMDQVIDNVFREELALFAVTQHVAEELGPRGHDARVLSNGVDINHFANAPAILPPRIKRLRVLVEGPADVPFKMVNPTVDMLKGVAGVEIVHVAADGSRPKSPIEFALGGVPHAAMAGVMASVDAIVKLSTIESFSLPILETFAAGGTAVAARFQGADLYIHDGLNALFVPRSDMDGARTAVERLRDDAPLLQKLRNSARATAKAFDLTIACNGFLAALDSVVEKCPHVPAKTPLLDRWRPVYRDVLKLWVEHRMRTPSVRPV